MTDVVKHCVTCREDGHTYLECPRVPFRSLVAGAFGVVDLLGPPRAEVERELFAIRRKAKLIDEKNELVNSYTGKPFHDDLVRDRIAAIEIELSTIK